MCIMKELLHAGALQTFSEVAFIHVDAADKPSVSSVCTGPSGFV